MDLFAERAEHPAPADPGAAELCGEFSQVAQCWGNEGGGCTVLARLRSGEAVRGRLEWRGELRAGRHYRFLGAWQDHPRWGWQFAFQSVLPDAPADPRALAAYLAKWCKGIGEVTAHRLVGAYADRTVQVVTEDPARPVADGLLSEEVARAAAKALAALCDPALRAAHLDLFALFKGHGFYGEALSACLKRWNSRASAVVRRDPFVLLTSGIPGCGFARCDKLYSALRLNPRRLKRQGLAAWDALRLRDGDTWLALDDALAAVRARIGGADPRERRAVALMLRGRWLTYRMTGGDAAPAHWVAERGKAASERECALALRRLREASAAWPMIGDDGTGGPFARLSDHQCGQLSLAVGSPVCVLTGSPGTGKTFVAAAVIQALVKLYGKTKVAVCAPTGKAAVRVTEKLQEAGVAVQATTIHRLLGVRLGGPKGWAFERGPGNPLEQRYVVVDECFPPGTMVDCESGPKPIELVRPDDRIYNAAGIDYVVATKKREIDRAVCITIGSQEIISSPCHPFFTSRGLVFARDLRPGDSLLQTAAAVRLLRQADHPVAAQRPSAVLRPRMLRALVDAIPGAKGQTLQRRSAEKGWRGAEAMALLRAPQSECRVAARCGAEPDAQRSVAGKGVPDASGDWTPAEGEGRQRPGHDRHGVRACGRPAGMEAPRRLLGSLQGRIPHPLQARSGAARKDALHRVGRPLSQLHRSPGSGPEEDGEVDFARVDRVEVLEPGHPRLDRFRDAAGKLYFYDLQAARHQSFSVGGLLVHNCSMIDVDLAACLLAACGPGTHLLFVGDEGQLPPVGHGAFLRDLIAAGTPRARLTEIHRNSGLIVHTCHSIRKGELPQLPQGLDAFPEVNLVHLPLGQPEPQQSKQDHLAAKLSAVYDWLQLQAEWDLVDGVQVIVARNATRKNLNRRLQQRLNPGGQKLSNVFRQGDKVICLKNGFLGRADSAGAARQEYVANGDLGRATGSRGRQLLVQLRSPDRLVAVPLGRAAEQEEAPEGEDGAVNTGCAWDLAYAVTCHKGQGSEWPVVVFVVEGAGKLGSREMLYTGLSRAKELCVVIGDRADINRYVKNEVLPDRKTFLTEMLRGEVAV